MKRSLLFALLLTARFVAGECTGPTLEVKITDQRLAASFVPNTSAPDLKIDQAVTITIGTTVLHTKVMRIKDIGLEKTISLEKPTDAKFENGTLAFAGGLDTDKATLGFTDSNGDDKSVDLCLVGQFNSSSESSHIGIAEPSDDSKNNPTSMSPGATAEAEANDKPRAVRFQYDRTMRRFFSASKDQSSNNRLIPEMRNTEQEFAVKLDTTDKKGKGFVDDNRLSAALFEPRKSFGDLLNRVRYGARVEHARALHGGDHNSDVKLAVEGGVPLLRAIGALAEPLQFRLEGGRRWQNVDGVRSDGNVAELALLYHLYVVGYRIDLHYGTLLNDVSHRPASTPRTQHTWKADLFMFDSDQSMFNAVASYENGHSGPVFTQLKQYFVGIGIKNLLSGIRPDSNR